MDDAKFAADSSTEAFPLWSRLTQLASLKFIADTKKSTSGWTGTGQGSVRIETVDDDTLLFHEEGVWSQNGGKTMRFTNVFRWTMLDHGDAVRLEHLRFGLDRPVYLFDLKPISPLVWTSCDGHVCRNDIYTATLEIQTESLDLHWSVRGPTMHESIRYTYS